MEPRTRVPFWYSRLTERPVNLDPPTTYSGVMPASPDAGIEFPQLVKGEGILQALHLDRVGHLAELAADGAAHMLSGESLQ